MDVKPKAQETEPCGPILAQGEKIPRRSMKQQKWESLRHEIHRMHVLENNTLKNTMQTMEEKHNFNARYDASFCPSIISSASEDMCFSWKEIDKLS
jgi:hypothetical protein